MRSLNFTEENSIARPLRFLACRCCFFLTRCSKEMYETTEWGRLLNRSNLVHYLCRYGSMLSSLDQPSVRSW